METPNTPTKPTSPSVYVGTYAKYNSGSIAGKWLSFDDYADRKDMLDACRALHSDEADPELMFQDFEGFPKALYDESSLPNLWELNDALKHTGLELDAVCEYLGNIGESITADAIKDALDAYVGTFKSFQDFADERADEMMDCHKGKFADSIRPYFDYEKWARDLKHDYNTAETADGVAIFQNV